MLDAAVLGVLLREAYADSECWVNAVARLSARLRIGDAGLEVRDRTGHACLDTMIAALPPTGLGVGGTFDVLFFGRSEFESMTDGLRYLVGSPDPPDHSAPGIQPTSAHQRMKSSVQDVEACYRYVLSSAPGTEGRIEFGIVIGGSGRTVRVETLSSTLPDARLENCVVAVVEEIAFSAPVGGGTVPLEYGYVFRVRAGRGEVGLIYDKSDLDDRRAAIRRTGALLGVKSTEPGPTWAAWKATLAVLKPKGAALRRCLGRAESLWVTLDAGGVVEVVESLGRAGSDPTPGICGSIVGLNTRYTDGVRRRLAFRFDGKGPGSSGLVPDHRFDSRLEQGPPRLILEGILVHPAHEGFTAPAQLATTVVARAFRRVLSRPTDCSPAVEEVQGSTFGVVDGRTEVRGLSYSCMDDFLAAVAVPEPAQRLRFFVIFRVVDPTKPGSAVPHRGFLPRSHISAVMTEAWPSLTNCLSGGGEPDLQIRSRDGVHHRERWSCLGGPDGQAQEPQLVGGRVHRGHGREPAVRSAIRGREDDREATTSANSALRLIQIGLPPRRSGCVSAEGQATTRGRTPARGHACGSSGRRARGRGRRTRPPVRRCLGSA
jgi:hypothetical protein